MADQQSEDFTIKGAAERAPSPSSEIPPRSPSKTSPRRSRSPSKSQASEASETSEASEEGETRSSSGDEPPLPDEPVPGAEAPPLPNEPVPEAVEDDGWEAKCDPASGHWYFVNRFTGISQWENPRIAAASASVPYSGAPGTEPTSGAPGTYAEPRAQFEPPNEPYLGYNPKIHGDFDPNADYAKFHQTAPVQADPAIDLDAAANMIGTYAQAATFNRRTGTYQSGDKNAEYHNDENKSSRQMNAFFDVDRAANSHDGRSLKAERAHKKMTKEQVKAFNEQRRARKEQKRREFLLS